MPWKSRSLMLTNNKSRKWAYWIAAAKIEALFWVYLCCMPDRLTTNIYRRFHPKACSSSLADDTNYQLFKLWGHSSLTLMCTCIEWLLIRWMIYSHNNNTTNCANAICRRFHSKAFSSSLADDTSYQIM